MANRTDPLITHVSGTDPQNLMEYITRQKIYDSRYWKETCFGLTVADVLEKAASLQTIGGLPTPFLCLTLKLLQLHPEPSLVVETFVDQDAFKYARALGALYVRLTGRPAEIYEALEPLYADSCTLRCYQQPMWSIVHMDEFIHQLLTSHHIVGISLPRLPARRFLQEAGYLPEGPRPTALKDVLMEHGGPLELLRFKAMTEGNPFAIAAWQQRIAVYPTHDDSASRKIKDTMRDDDPFESSNQRPKKKARNYDNLFKKSNAVTSGAAHVSQAAPLVEGSEDYWNAERARLGLSTLRK